MSLSTSEMFGVADIDPRLHLQLARNLTVRGALTVIIVTITRHIGRAITRKSKCLRRGPQHQHQHQAYDGDTSPGHCCLSVGTSSPVPLVPPCGHLVSPCAPLVTSG